MLKTNRKFSLAIVSMLLCTVCYLGTGFNEKLNANYSTFVMAIGMALGLYSGANVANKHVLGRHGALPIQPLNKEEESEEDKEPIP